MNNKLDNSLRVKITGKCNRDCFFCHQEGGMNSIQDISFSCDFKKIVDLIHAELGIETMSITGGEPLYYDGLYNFMFGVFQNTNIKKFSLTTNGTIEKSKMFWKKLKDCGLCKVNLSISDILNDVDALNHSFSSSIYDNQLFTINALNELGIEVTINIVVFNDKKYILNILENLFSYQKKNYRFNIALLPELSNQNTFDYSQKTINAILDHLQCKKITLKHRKGTSNTVCEYETKNGRYLQVKTTKPTGMPKWLNNLCSTCKNKEQCQEGFYGIRVEKRREQFFIRLCLYRSDPMVLMTLDQFINSSVYREIRAIWT